MDIPALQAFIAIVETGSFSKAGRRLFLTQPAISKRISMLESELQTHLFDRIGRKVSLTHAGQALLIHARKILTDTEDARREIEALQGEVRGELILAASHHVGLHRLPPVLRRYASTYPDAELAIQFMDSEHACHAVESGNAEMALVTLPLTNYGGLKSIPVWEDRLAITVSSEQPEIASRSDILKHLRNTTAILPPPGTFTHTLVMQSLERANILPEKMLISNYMETIRMMISVGLGWGLLPQTMLDSTIKELHVREINVTRTLGAVVHPGRYRSQPAKAMLDLLLG